MQVNLVISVARLSMGRHYKVEGRKKTLLIEFGTRRTSSFLGTKSAASLKHGRIYRPTCPIASVGYPRGR
jgi:hypothetical protein